MNLARHLPRDSLARIDIDASHVHVLSVADSARAKFPGVPILTPKQVADVLYGRTSRGVVNGIRARLTSGALLGIRVGARWQIRVEDLVRAYDEMADDARAAREAKARGPLINPQASPPAQQSKRPWRAPPAARTRRLVYEAPPGQRGR